MRYLIGVGFIAISACGGSGSGGSDDGGVGGTAATEKTGTFIDSPVINIGYRTETLQGVTNALGEYQYLPGETVTFFIGDLTFPAVKATGMVTPLDIADTQDTANPKVINIIRLLQTLDKDGDPSNGITITDQAKSSAVLVDFDLSEADFAAAPDVMALITNANLDIPVTELVDAVDALSHFKQTLAGVGIFPTEFNFGLYDDFNDPGGEIDTARWATQGGATPASTVEVINGALHATAIKDGVTRANQGLWVQNATNVLLADFQAFRADFTILQATGDAVNRAQILLGIPLATPDYFADTGINFYDTGEVVYFIEIFNRLNQPITEIASGTIATVNPAETHTLSIGWDGSNYIFQVDNIVPVVVPMTAETDISLSNNWEWAAVRSTVKDAGTGTTEVKIDNVELGSIPVFTPFQWTIDVDSIGPGIHSIMMEVDVSPLAEADIEALSGKLVWNQTQTDLCFIQVRDTGPGYVRIGDGFESDYQGDGCSTNAAMETAFNNFGLPTNACVTAIVGGLYYQYCSPLNEI